MRCKAFTLIELLVVIAIIALLMAILMPSLQAAREQGRMVVCQSQMKHWGGIFTMYTSDNNGNFHPGWAEPFDENQLWVHIYRPYFGDEDIFRTCPSAKKIDTDYKNGGSKYCWGLRTDWVGEYFNYGSYGLNGWVCNEEAEATWNSSVKDYYWRRIDAKGQLSQMPLLCDSGYWKTYPEEDQELHGEYDWCHTLTSISDVHADYMSANCIDRHNCTIDILFFDSSVSRTGLRELWDLKWHKKWQKPRWVETYEWPSWMKR